MKPIALLLAAAALAGAQQKPAGTLDRTVGEAPQLAEMPRQTGKVGK